MIYLEYKAKNFKKSNAEKMAHFNQKCRKMGGKMDKNIEKTAKLVKTYQTTHFCQIWSKRSNKLKKIAKITP